MKRTIWILTPLLVVFLHSLQSNAQSVLDEGDRQSPTDTPPPQRIGIPAPATMDIAANESGRLEGFCFDEYLRAPMSATTFQHILAGEKDVVVHRADGRITSLEDAITAGDVAVVGLELHLTFKNRSGAPLSIELRRPVVLWDRPGGKVNPLALRAIEIGANGTLDRTTFQQKVWRVTTAERLLVVLGHYDGSVWDIDGRIGSSLSQFQREYGLQQNGLLDDATIDGLHLAASRLQGRLNRFGLRDEARRRPTEDLAEQIRAYERSLGLPATGRWGTAIAKRFEADERLLMQLTSITPGKKPISAVLSDSTRHPAVLTYLRASGKLMIVIETSRGVELWSREEDTLSFVARGSAAFEQIDAAAARLAARLSKGRNIVLYPRIGKSTEVTLQLGNTSVRLDAARLAKYLKGGAIPAPLAAALLPFAGANKDTADRSGDTLALIIYRGPLVQGRSKRSRSLLRDAGLEQIDGEQLVEALRRSYGGKLAIHLSNDLRNDRTWLQGAASPALPGRR